MQRELEALRSRLDILDLGREYLRGLRRSGKSWVALCPFHEEKTPSFHLNPALGLYHCFGCQKGGDAINFYMEMERLDFKGAIEGLCERVGLPRPVWSAKTKELRSEEKLRDAVKKALALAANLYADALSLREDPNVEAARQYCLHVRNFDPKIVQGYRLGFAPRANNWLFTALVSKHGVDPRILEKAGLAAVSARDGRYLDFFRGRIVFPVLDLQGNVCGFGGRVVPLGPQELQVVAPVG